MKKKYKKRIVVGILLISIVSFIFFLGGFNFPFALSDLNNFECLGGGGSIYSLSLVDYLDYDSNIGSSAWKVSLNPSQGSQCLKGSFSSSEIKDYGENKDALNGFSIDVKTSPQVCEYDIQRTGRSIREIEMGWRETWKFWNIDDISSECNNKAITLGNGEKAVVWSTGSSFLGSTLPWSSVLPPYRCYYFSQSWLKNYRIGDIIFDKLSFKTKLILNTDKGVYEGEISNTQYIEGDSGKINSGKQVWLGSGREVRAEFEGMMSTGTRCPSVSGDLNARAVDYGGWRTIGKDELRDYEGYDNNGMWSCIVGASTKTSLENCGFKYNSFAKKALTEKKLFYKDSFASTLGSKIKFVYENLKISYPIIGLRIKADILGVATRGGIPYITGKRSECFNDGYDSFLEVDVKNKGSAVGNFYSMTRCNKPFNVLTQPSNTIQPGEVSTFRINVRSDVVTEKTTDSCSFKVWDDESGDEVTTSIPICSEPSTDSCTVGEVRCSSDLSGIEECLRSGKWDLTNYCGDNEKCVDDGFVSCVSCIGEGMKKEIGIDCCSGLIERNGVCTIPVKKCDSDTKYVLNLLFGDVFSSLKCEPTIPQRLKSIFSFPLILLRLSLVPIVFLFSMLFSFQFFSDIKFIKKSKYGKFISIASSIFLSFVVGFLVFSLFWFGLFFVLIYLIGIFLYRRFGR